MFCTLPVDRNPWIGPGFSDQICIRLQEWKITVFCEISAGAWGIHHPVQKNLLILFSKVLILEEPGLQLRL